MTYGLESAEPTTASLILYPSGTAQCWTCGWRGAPHAGARVRECPRCYDPIQPELAAARKPHAWARTRVGTKEPARNAPCPCGSGRKFKKCCGA